MEKKNTGLVVTIIILSLCLLGTSGYVVYDKFLVKEEFKEQVEIEEKNNDKKEELIEEKNVTENSYDLFVKNMKENMNSKFNDNNLVFKSYSLMGSSFSYSLKLNKNGELFFTSYKAIDDVSLKTDKYDNYKIR